MEDQVYSPVIADLHSHILPGIDDGSQDISESIAMLQSLHDQNVEIVCATPHFYTHKNTIQNFLFQRERAAKELKNAVSSDMPELRLGAEVTYFDGISHSVSVRELAIEGTPLLLVEMPFTPWNQRMISDIISLNSDGHVRVILAHIERYLLLEPSSLFTQLLRNGILMQSNADFFLSKYGKRAGLRMLARGQIHAVASDSHNMQSRPPRIAEAVNRIRSVGGEDAIEQLSMFYQEFFRIKRVLS